MNRLDFCLCILAGGAGKRLGGDKPRRIIAGKPLIEHVLARLPDAQRLLSGDEDLAHRYGLEFVADATFERAGPLAGILAGLRHARQMGFAQMISLPCDAPFLPADLVPRLLAAGDNIAVAMSSGQLHPTIARWPVTLVAALQLAHEQDDTRRVMDFIKAQDFVPVEWADQPIDPFFNLNTAYDLALAEEMLRTGETPPQLDLRGLKCPLPALKAAKALAALPAGAVLDVVCTDPMAAIDLPHMVVQRADQLLAQEQARGELRFLIRRS